jgi:hypothetical protein
MIETYPNQRFEATLLNAPHGLVGTLTFSIINAETQEVMLSPRATGINEVANGQYWTSATAPLVADDYLVVWADGSTTAVEELVVSPALGITPTVDEVALLLRTRTVGDVSGGLGGDTQATSLTTFTDHTRPTAVEVASVIATSLGAVRGMLRGPVPDYEESSARHAVALYAAILIETSFFRETSNADALAALRGMLRDTVGGVNETIALNQGYGFGTLKIGTTLAGSTRRLSNDVVPGLDT